MKIHIIISVMVGLSMAAPSERDAADKTIVELATELGATTLVDLVTKANLTGPLSGNGPFTVFAPSNAAFAKLPESVLDYLEKNIPVLTELLTFHVVPASIKSTDIKNEETVATLEGAKLRTNIYDDGKLITVDGSPVSSPDHMASNGVIHVIDTVMHPIPEGTVVDVATSLDFFSTLVTALETADLVDVLKGDGPFTVFAPTNQAFAKIPKHELDRILANKPLLTAILKYHVVGSTQYSAGLKDDQSVPTLEGSSVKVHIRDDGVFINDSKVEVANFPVTNGVIHIIDTVLIPTPPPRH